MSRHTVKRLLQSFALFGLVAMSAGLVYIQASGSKLLSIQTGSMVPDFHRGYLVMVTPIPENKLALGDVITFVNPHNTKTTLTHRIVKLPSAASGYKIVTKGDANLATDTPINPSSVVGVVRHKLAYAGFAMDFVRKPLGLALLIYLPALAIILDELRRLAAYYKSQEPYLLPGHRSTFYRVKKQKHIKASLAALVFCITLTGMFAVPAQAALMSTVTLTNNSILITTVPTTPHILFRKVKFECSDDNTKTVNKLPSILFYNPTKQNISTGDWYLQSSNGRIETFPSKTIFKAKSNYNIEPDLKAGVKYTGDYLALFNSSGIVVDAISWGTDTTYLNPPLAGISDGTVFRRVSLVTNTDTASDWTVSVQACTP